MGFLCQKQVAFGKNESLLHSHPGSSLCVVVDKKWSSIRSTANLPASWQEASLK